MYIHKGMFRPSIEWERFKYSLPKSKAQVEIVREIIMNDDDLDNMELSRQNN
jgi:hypothetical protein